jgi:hypothetical protein
MSVHLGHSLIESPWLHTGIQLHRANEYLSCLPHVLSVTITLMIYSNHVLTFPCYASKTGDTEDMKRRNENRHDF